MTPNTAQLQLSLEQSRPMKDSLAKVYRMLVEAGSRGVTSGEFLSAYVARYSARIHELRGLGMAIHAEKVDRRSQWRYVLETAEKP